MKSISSSGRARRRFIDRAAATFLLSWISLTSAAALTREEVIETARAYAEYRWQARPENILHGKDKEDAGAKSFLRREFY